MTQPNQDYLEPGPLCDPSNSSITELAERISTGKNDFETAHALFDWVRDNIEYRVLGIESADATLGRGQGCCLAKSNLLVALARARGIPARYRQFSGYLNSPDERIARVKHEHIVPELYVNDRWIIGDPAYNIRVASVYEVGEMGKTTWHGLTSEKVLASLPNWMWIGQRIVIWLSPSAYAVRRKVARATRCCNHQGDHP